MGAWSRERQGPGIEGGNLIRSVRPPSAVTGKRTEARGGHLLRNLLLFGRVLRGLGLNIHTGRMLDAVRVLDLVGVRRKGDLSDALKTVLVHRQQDLALFDEAFDVFWRAKRDDLTTLDLRSLGEQRRFRRPQVVPP